MKTSIAILITLSFIGISVFGVLAMGHSGSHSGGCIAMAAGGVKSPCPLLDPLGFANFHIDIFQSFSSATMGVSFNGTLAVLSAMILMLAGWYYAVAGSSGVLFSRPLPLQKIILAEHFFLARRKVNSWISFHETSPTHF